MTKDNYWTRQGFSRRRMLKGSVMAVSGAALLAAGCGDDDDDDSNSEPTSGTGTATGTATAPAVSPTIGTPTGTIVVGLPNLGVQDYDPVHYAGTGELYVNKHVSDALAVMGPENNVYIPAIASAWEQPDNTTWVFTLRDGVKFHDGNTLTADDVKFSFERAMDSANKPVALARLGQLIQSIQTTDSEVRLQLKAPALLIPLIAGADIYPKAAFEAAAGKFGEKPIGVGPFKFASTQRDSSATLEAFEECYRKVPNYKTLELRMIPDSSTRLAALQAGETDIMLGVAGPAIPTIGGDRSLKLLEQQSTSLNHVIFTDLLKPETVQGSPWADVRMRQAVAHAIDLDAINDKLYFGHATPVAVPWAVPGLPGVPDLKPRKYDPQRAKALIGEAGHNGLGFDLYTYDSGAMGGNSDTAEAVATYLNAVGFKVQVRKMEIAAFFAAYRGGDWAGKAALTVSVVGGRAAETFYDAVNPAASTPYYSSAEFFKTATDIVGATSEDDRNKLVAELSQKLYDDVANVPLVSLNYLQGVGKNVKDWVPRNLIGYQVGMEYVERA